MKVRYPDAGPGTRWVIVALLILAALIALIVTWS
jgi:hypothetical protein